MTPSFEPFLQRRPYNAVTDFVDANVARGLGNKVAFTDSERSLTYAQLQEGTYRFAAALRALGLREENRLVLVAHDTVDHPIAFWGAIRAGIVPVPVNTLLTPEQYAYLFADSRAAAIVVAAALAPTVLSLRDRLPHLRAVIVVGASARERVDLPDVHFFEELLAKAEPMPFAAPTMSDEIALWMYTSGSTGDPKAVRHVHTSLMATARLMGQGVIGIREDDVAFSAAKLSFSYGLGNAVSFPMSVGASTVLRLCISAGEALPAHLGERWRAVVGIDILDGLGSTEMLQTFLSNRPGDVRYGSTGKPVPGYEVKIVDESGRELPAGEIGELVVRGPSAGESYWNHRAKSRRTFVGEWTYTGDKYLRDEDGYYYYCGRTDDMFKVNGMWVSPFEVEAALVSHEAVLEAAVIGKQDGDGLVKPKAFIVLKNGYAADDGLLETLRTHVKDRAGPWKYPRWIDIRHDLPRTATGKIQRFKLRD
jgi:4-hydroxybenzoate-CoA ligase